MSTLRTVKSAASDKNQLDESKFPGGRRNATSEFKESTRLASLNRPGDDKAQRRGTPIPSSPSISSAASLQIEDKFIPKHLHAAYKEVLTVALNLNRLDKGSDGKSGILKDIGQAKVTIIPTSNLNIDPITYLQDLGVGPKIVEQFRKANQGFQGDAITLTLGTTKEKFHLTFIRLTSFQSLSQITTTVNHELAHVALVENGTKGMSRRLDEVKAHDKSIPSLQRIRAGIGKLANQEPQKAVLGKLYGELKAQIDSEIKLRDHWKAN